MCVPRRRAQASPLGASDRWVYVGGGDREFADPRLNEGFLRRAARESGGRYVRAADAPRLMTWLQEAARQNAVPVQNDLWHEPWALGALVLAVVGRVGAAPDVGPEMTRASGARLVAGAPSVLPHRSRPATTTPSSSRAPPAAKCTRRSTTAGAGRSSRHAPRQVRVSRRSRRRPGRERGAWRRGWRRATQVQRVFDGFARRVSRRTICSSSCSSGTAR